MIHTIFRSVEPKWLQNIRENFLYGGTRNGYEHDGVQISMNHTCNLYNSVSRKEINVVFFFW
jgi:hypothetical protein